MNGTTTAKPGRRRAMRLAGLSALALLLVLPACGSDGDGGESADKTIVIGTQGGLTMESFMEAWGNAFEEETGIKIVTDTTTNATATQVESQNKSGKVTWDIIYAEAAGRIAHIDQLGYLAPWSDDIKSALLENRREDSFDEHKFIDFALSSVVVCNKDKVETCPNSMEEFFDAEEFPGTRTMFGGDPLVNVMSASQAIGGTAEEVSQPDIDAVFDKLNEVKPDVRVWYSSGDQSQAVLRSGDVDMGILWDGRAYTVAEEPGMNLQISHDGAIYQPQYTAILEGAPHQENAEKLIEYVLTHPEGAAEWMQAANYGIPDPVALESLPPDFLETLADAPQNYEESAQVDIDWSLENADVINEKWRDFVS